MPKPLRAELGDGGRADLHIAMISHSQSLDGEKESGRILFL